MTTLTPIVHQFWIFSATIFINKFYNVTFLCIVLLRHVMCFLSTASTSEETSPPPTTSPTQTVGTVITTGTVPVSSSTQPTVGTAPPPPTVGTASPPPTVGTEETSPPQTVGTASPPSTVGTTSPPQTVGTTSPPQTVGTTSHPQTVGTTSPPQTAGTTSPPQTVGTTSPPQTIGTTSPPQTVGTTSPPQTVGTTSPPQTVGTTSPPQTVGTTSPPQTVGTTSPLQTVGTTTPPQTVGTTSPPQTVGTTSPPQTVGTIVTTGTVPFSSTQPTNNPSSDGATTTAVIIVVAVVIILVVIVVGVVILVFLLRAKKRKQLLVINKLQNVTIENQDIEMKLKQEETIEKEANSSTCLPPYAEIRTETQPKVPNKSEELVEYLNLKSTVTGGYSEIELEQDDTLPSKPPRHFNISDLTSEEIQSSAVYQDIDQQPSSTSVQEAEVYTVPDTTSSPTVGKPSVIYETVYSEPIQPSLFTDVTETPSYSDSLTPYAPIYTLPINLPKSKEVLLKVFGSNIREIRELGMGQFGKVILAETVGLSAKDLRLSESDDDDSKSTLVAVKKLKSGAPSVTKEAFEKEVNFMSRLTDRNVIRILGVCHEDTPFIMMEYMEKGDLNQYLQKFQIHTTDSEPQGQLTIKTLVYMTTQIASAMKYLASHNYVHRDLATRNCLVGPNYLVKISDFGMSRSLYDSHYYHIHGRFALPVRWMAYECFYGKFSQKSDVWAFGVTMWEIFTLAKEQPYNGMSDKQVIEDALKGKNRKILAKPDMCPLKLYKIMLECWEHNSELRATFEELFQLLTSIESGYCITP